MLWPVTEQSQRAAMSKMWAIFPIGQENPIHLRAIWGKGVPDAKPVKNITFTAATYPDVADRQQAFEDMALKLNKLGYNIYTCFNPISPAFAGDEQNGLSVADADIVCRRYLLVDLDRLVTSQPATDDEVDEAFRVAGEVERDICHSNGRDPITVSSGNGAHIYLPIEMGNDDAGKVLCQKMLKAFAEKYDTGTIKVDTAVFNASRITKVLGTVARKGVEMPDPNGMDDRYYRMAGLVE